MSGALRQQLSHSLGRLIVPVQAALGVGSMVVASWFSRPTGGYQHIWRSDGLHFGIDERVAETAQHVSAESFQSQVSVGLADPAEIAQALQILREPTAPDLSAVDRAAWVFLSSFCDRFGLEGGALGQLRLRLKEECVEGRQPSGLGRWDRHADTSENIAEAAASALFHQLWNGMKRSARTELGLGDRLVVPVAPHGILLGAVTVFTKTRSESVEKSFLALVPKVAVLLQSLALEVGKGQVARARSAGPIDWEMALDALGYFAPGLVSVDLALRSPTHEVGSLWRRFATEDVTEKGRPSGLPMPPIELGEMNGVIGTLTARLDLPAAVDGQSPVARYLGEVSRDAARLWWSVVAGREERFESPVTDALGFERVASIVASATTPVLILGASGTGKERVARLLHDASERRAKPFIVVNCAASSANLVLSDVIGHVKGAYTGAETARAGALEKANGGTLFLDEIADLPLEGQGALLRVLDGHDFGRLGEHEAKRQTTARVVAATNREGTLTDPVRFRSDLLARLSTWVVRTMAAISERDDLALIAAQERLDVLGAGVGVRVEMTMTAVARLGQLTREGTFDEVGNLRAVRSAVERAFWLARYASVRDAATDRLFLDSQHIDEACQPPWLAYPRAVQPPAVAEVRPRPASDERVSRLAEAQANPTPDRFLALDPEERHTLLDKLVTVPHRQLQEHPELASEPVLRLLAALYQREGHVAEATRERLAGWTTAQTLSLLLRHAESLGMLPYRRTKATRPGQG